MDEVILKQTRLESVEVHDLLEEWNDELIATVPRFVPGGGSTVDDAEFLAPDGVLLVAVAGQSAVGCGGVRRLHSSLGIIPPAEYEQRYAQALATHPETVTSPNGVLTLSVSGVYDPFGVVSDLR